LNGDLARLTDPFGNARRTTYEGLRRVAKTIDASAAAPDPACGTAGVTCYAYDALDNPTSVIDGRNNATRYLRNGFGEAVEPSSPDAGLTLYTYDAAGRMLSEATNDGRTTAYTRDVQVRVLASATVRDGGSKGGGMLGPANASASGCVVVPLAGGTTTCPREAGASLRRRRICGGPGPAGTGTGTHTVTYTWDSGTYGKGRLASIVEPVGSTVYAYDKRGNVLAETRTLGGAPYVTAYQWDAGDNLAQLTYPTGIVVNYVRDSLGRVTSVSFKSNAGAAALTLASDIAYDPFGPERTAIYNPADLNLALAQSYDLAGRIAALSVKQGANALHELGFGYDDAGRLTSRGDAVTPANDEAFQYTATDRLSQAAGAYGTESFAYDAVGNRLSRTLGSAVTSTASRAPATRRWPRTASGAGTTPAGASRSGGWAPTSGAPATASTGGSPRS
jgi:YD repeat-containing protein